MYEFFGVERDSRTYKIAPMPEALQILTEKEKQTLRLMGRGHDAKSMARHLGLSVHTVNERLREARRKLSVSSSREAARLLLDSEGAAPDSVGDKLLGEAGATRIPAEEAATTGARTPRPLWVLAGVLIMSIMLGIALLAMQPQSAAVPNQPAAASQTRIEVTRAARDWLALVDAGRWEESWRGTGAQFRSLNTVETWTHASEEMRRRVGAMQARTDLSYETVPAPPNGYEMVKFRTRFANRPDAVETVTLAREDGAWKVVGVWVD